MDVTEDTVRGVCTDAVFERGERYLAEGRVREIHRVDTTVTAVVSGCRQYDVRVDLTADEFAPRCDCPYDGPGTCKHVVAVLLRCVDDRLPDEGARLDAALNGTDVDELRAFLREELVTDADLRDRFLARVGASTRRSVDELRTSIDRRFEELLRGSTTQVKFILYSLALLSEENPNTEGFSTSRIYERYQETAEKIDATILSEHRVYELLKEQAFLGVVESTRTGGGRGQGSYLEHRLVQDTEIVLKSVLRDSRLEDLA